MPFVLILIGLMLTVVSVRGTQDKFFATLSGDFTGQNNFTYWALAIVGIGSLGYVKPLKPVVNSFLLLLFVVLFIGAGKKGFFGQLTNALNTALSTPAAQSLNATSAALSAPSASSVPVAPNSNPVSSVLGSQDNEPGVSLLDALSPEVLSQLATIIQ